MKRKPDETYEDYRRRRNTMATIQRLKLKGRLWWNSWERGTYRREIKNGI